MNQEQLIRIVSEKLRMIRLEQEYSQDEMSALLGLSKKTLIQIEKGRTVANWNVAVTAVALFEHSEILQNALGDEPLEVVRLVTHDRMIRQPEPVSKTMGGKVWWSEVRKAGRYRLQQNVISQHYRIIDENNYRWFSAFDEQEAIKQLQKLSSKN